MTLAVISKPSAAQQQPQVRKLHVKKGQSHLPTANEKTSQSMSVSKSAFEALCGSRIILEPSCVHALAHQEEAKNLPWTWCALTPQPPPFLLYLAMSKPQLKWKEWAGAEGILLHVHFTHVSQQESQASAHWEVQAQGLHTKLSFYAINSHVKNSFWEEPFKIRNKPRHREQHQGQTVGHKHMLRKGSSNQHFPAS